MGHIVTHTTHRLNINQSFRFLMRTLASILTLGAASAALFLLGFHVIPVFADKAPQMFSEQVSSAQLLKVDTQEK